MRSFFDEYRRITLNDIPKEIFMGWFAQKCKCGYPVGMKANPIGLDRGTFTKYCTGCKKEFLKIELEDDELSEFLIEFTTSLMGGAR